MNKPTLLEKVRKHIAPLKGYALNDLALATGISYDTLLRIRDAKSDPGFSMVQRLADHFRVPGR